MAKKKRKRRKTTVGGYEARHGKRRTQKALARAGVNARLVMRAETRARLVKAGLIRKV